MGFNRINFKGGRRDAERGWKPVQRVKVREQAEKATLSGQHDLERVVELINFFKIPAYLCINKFDINPEMSDIIEKKAMASGVKVLGRIRYDQSVTEAQVKKLPVVELTNAPAAADISTMWNTLLQEITTVTKLG